MKKNGIIIWDDYDPHKFEVKNVVNEIIKKYKFECELIEFRGHLFGAKAPEKQAGEIIMRFIK